MPVSGIYGYHHLVGVINLPREETVRDRGGATRIEREREIGGKGKMKPTQISNKLKHLTVPCDLRYSFPRIP